MNQPAEELAEAAYTEYGEAADWKNFQGNPMPLWAELPQEIRDRWLAAAGKVRDMCDANRARYATAAPSRPLPAST